MNGSIAPPAFILSQDLLPITLLFPAPLRSRSILGMNLIQWVKPFGNSIDVFRDGLPAPDRCAARDPRRVRRRQDIIQLVQRMSGIDRFLVEYVQRRPLEFPSFKQLQQRR